MTKPTFASLSSSDRRDFLLAHRGFLKDVQANLAAQGIVRAMSSISRTWSGHYERAMPALVRALEAEYQRLTGNSDESSTDALPPEGLLRATGALSISAGSDPATSWAGVARHGAVGRESALQISAGNGSSPVPTTARARKQEREKQRGAWLRELPTGWRLPVEQDSSEGKAIAVEAYFTIHEVAQILAIDDSAAHRLLRNEPGVVRLMLPGSKRPKIRVPMSVIVRLIHRSTVPWPRRCPPSK